MKTAITIMIRVKVGFLSNHHLFDEAEEFFNIFAFPFIRD
jgi:hypothetical protein